MDATHEPRDTHSIPALGLVVARPAPGWEVVYLLEPQAGEAVLREVRIRPIGELPLGGLPARLARDIVRPGVALALHRDWLRDQWDDRDPALRVTLALLRGVAASEGRSLAGIPRPDTKGWKAVVDAIAGAVAAWASLPATVPTDRPRRLAETAGLYVRARQAGERAPNKTVAEWQGRSAQAVRDDIHEARQEGLLTKTKGFGYSGGSLTPTAVAILKEVER